MIELDIHKKLSSPSGEMLLQVQLEIEKESFVTLYGKSGAGKTSLLRILAGLLPPDKGLIAVNGATWLDTGRRINLAPRKRKTGYVFQDPSLFPNMTVKENLSFALNKGQDKKIIGELIEITELGELQHRKPAALSGGQKQRVALARALVPKPEILLLDEPLSALDAEMRDKLQDYILELHRQFHLTTILVSHDTPEILKMSDKLLLLEEGKITKQGRPEEVFTGKGLNGKRCFAAKVIAVENQGFITISTERKDLMLRPGDKILVSVDQALVK